MKASIIILLNPIKGPKIFVRSNTVIVLLILVYGWRGGWGVIDVTLR